MIRKCLVVGVIFLLLGICIIPAIAQSIGKQSISRGDWLYVGGSGPGNYTSIQDAINDSSDGDTVFVYQGNYTENIVINKSISVLGESKETTWISGYGYYLYDHVVLIVANDIVFSGFTVYLITETCPGIAINDSQNCIVSNNVVKSTWGIKLHNASKNIVRENRVLTSNGGIDIGDYTNKICSENIIENNTITNSGNPQLIYNFGIHFQRSAENNIIRNNYLYDCVKDGIYLEDAKNNTIEHNIITCFNEAYEYGICLFGSSASGNSLIGNDVSNYTYGILTNNNQKNLLISGNIFHNTTWGVNLFAGPFNVMVTNNIIRDNGLGVDIQAGYNITFEGNQITSNKIGMMVEYYSSNILIRKNNFTFNREGLYICLSPEVKITMNNFIRNWRHAEFQYCLSTWDNNYWNHARNYPKLIFGVFLFIQVDWHPAQEPYDIPGMS